MELDEQLRSLGEFAQEHTRLFKTINGLTSLAVSGCVNHREPRVFSPFRSGWLATATRSYGVLATRDDEDGDQSYDLRRHTFGYSVWPSGRFGEISCNALRYRLIRCRLRRFGMSSEAAESLNDTLNSGVANVTDSLSCSEYSEDAALVGQLAGLSFEQRQRLAAVGLRQALGTEHLVEHRAERGHELGGGRQRGRRPVQQRRLDGDDDLDRVVRRRGPDLYPDLRRGRAPRRADDGRGRRARPRSPTSPRRTITSTRRPRSRPPT